MRKHFLQTLLVVVLSVIGVSQCWAEEKEALTWTRKEWKYWGGSSETLKSYNSTGAWDNNSGIFSWEDNFTVHYNRADLWSGHIKLIALYQAPIEVPSYSKLVKKADFKLYLSATNGVVLVTSSLSAFDNETTAKSSNVIVGGTSYSWTSNTIAAPQIITSSQTECSETCSKTWTMDNSTGSTTKTENKYLMYAFGIQDTEGIKKNPYGTGQLQPTNETDTWYYYKYITFDANGGEGSMSQQVIENSGNLTTNFFTRLGYVFTGWNTQADGKGTAYTNGQAITATASDKGAITLYAQWKKALTWTRKEWKYWGGGSETLKSYNSTDAGSLSTIFGWDDNFTVRYKGIDLGTNGHYKLIALYQAPIEVPSYSKLVKTADFNLYLSATNGIVVVTSSLSAFDDETTAKSSNVIVGGTSYEWTPNTIGAPQINTSLRTEYYEATNSKTWTMDNSTGSTTKTENKYLMYAFGIQDIESINKTPYGTGQLRPTNETDTWYYYKYITFDGNGFTGGSMSQQVIENSGNLTTNAFTRTGYTFNGWNTQADGKGTTYANGAEITATAGSKGPVTLYAQWKRTVTIDQQDGTSTTTIEVNCNSTYSTLPADPTRTGYTFKGWFDAPTGGNQYQKSTPSTNVIPAILYAQWNVVNYTITYNENGGSAITEHLNYTIETPTFALPKPTKKGYTFGGWFTNEACTDGPITQIVKGSTENKTFYAKWNAIDYTITYHENGGSEITEHKTYTIETATFALPVPTKDGYTFGGWFTNEACTEGPITEIAQGSTENKTFYAKWNENVVSDGSNKDNVTEAAAEVNAALSTWVAECAGSKAINLTINRTIYKDGYYNTLCLPFDMSAAQISATFGTYKELKQFASATVQGSGASRSIVIEVKDATTIEAGKAYLISFEKGDNLTQLTFNGVIVSTTEATDESGTLAYQGILAPYQLPYENQDYLFLGANNTLYWAINDGTFMKGFRAYFKVDTNSAQTPYHAGMRAAFGGRQTPTDLSPVVNEQEVRKLLEQGRVVIVNKGVKYNMNGATIQ